VRSQHWVAGLAILTFGLCTSPMLAVAQSTAPPMWENETFTKFRRDEGNPDRCASEARELRIYRASVIDTGGTAEITLADEQLNFTTVTGHWSLTGSALQVTAPSFLIEAVWDGTKLRATIVHTGQTFRCNYYVSGSKT